MLREYGAEGIRIDCSSSNLCKPVYNSFVHKYLLCIFFIYPRICAGQMIQWESFYPPTRTLRSAKFPPPLCYLYSVTRNTFLKISQAPVSVLQGVAQMPKEFWDLGLRGYPEPQSWHPISGGRPGKPLSCGAVRHLFGRTTGDSRVVQTCCLC